MDTSRTCALSAVEPLPRDLGGGGRKGWVVMELSLGPLFSFCPLRRTREFGASFAVGLGVVPFFGGGGNH